MRQPIGILWRSAHNSASFAFSTEMTTSHVTPGSSERLVSRHLLSHSPCSQEPPVNARNSVAVGACQGT